MFFDNCIGKYGNGKFSLKCLVHFVYVGQATKSIRWMPWRQKTMKDVVKLRKASGSCTQTLIRGCPNGETRRESCRVIAR